MKVKMRVDEKDREYVRATLFAGVDTLANIGVLTMRVEEYQLIGAALSLGAERMQGHLTVTHDDTVLCKTCWDMASENNL